MPSQLHIEFDRVRAEYLLVDTAVGRAWQQLIRDPRVNLDRIQNWQIFEPDHKERILARLSELTGNHRWTDDDFNHWHRQFEQNHQHSAHWHEINLLIHQAQDQHPGDRRRIGFFDYDPKLLPLPEITEEHLECFSYSRRPGDLLLGYHTIGKDLWSAYGDGDHELVRSNSITPQRHIGPEFIMVLDAPYQPYAMMMDSVSKWLEEISVDLPNRRRWCLGRPLLGRLITDLEDLRSNIGRDLPRKISLVD